MAIKPIRDDKEHRATIDRIEALWGSPLNSPEGDELDVLATLVDVYEAARWPDGELDPIDALRAIMDDMQKTQGDLAQLLGSRSRASEVLNRKRALTVAMIWKISRAWSIPADLLVKPYALTSAA